MDTAFQLAYLSEATRPMTEDDIQKLLVVARANNGQLGVTGLLSLNAGHFLQLLEGHETFVVDLFNKISKDARHDKIKVVYEGVSGERLFSRWSMAYKRIEAYSLTLRSRLEDFIGVISRGEMLYNPNDVLALFEELRASE